MKNRCRRISSLTLLAIILLTTGGCGLKGDLYIPEPEPVPTDDTDDDGEIDEQATDIDG